GGGRGTARKGRSTGLTAWSVMLRGIRYRPGRSLGVFLLALVATTAAVLAPAYSRAAQQSVLTDGLRSAPADATSLVVGAKGTADATPAAFSDLDEIRLAVTRQLTREPAVADRLGHPTGAVDTDVTLPGPAGTLVAKFARREGAC